MNKRIRELADQARFTHQVPYPSEDEVFQKFGELVVQACISKIAMIGVTNWDNDEIAWCVETAIDSIQNHFGVDYE